MSCSGWTSVEAPPASTTELMFVLPEPPPPLLPPTSHEAQDDDFCVEALDNDDETPSPDTPPPDPPPHLEMMTLMSSSAPPAAIASISAMSLLLMPPSRGARSLSCARIHAAHSKKGTPRAFSMSISADPVVQASSEVRCLELDMTAEAKVSMKWASRRARSGVGELEGGVGVGGSLLSRPGVSGGGRGAGGGGVRRDENLFWGTGGVGGWEY